MISYTPRRFSRVLGPHGAFLGRLYDITPYNPFRLFLACSFPRGRCRNTNEKSGRPGMGSRSLSSAGRCLWFNPRRSIKTLKSAAALEVQYMLREVQGVGRFPAGRFIAQALN